MSEHDHHHSDLQKMVQEEVQAALTRPEFLQSLILGTLGHQSIILARQAEEMSPPRMREALTPPAPYNEAGDTLILMGRRLQFNENAATLIVTYSASEADPTDVSFSTIVYRDAQVNCSQTKFIEVEAPARQELERQLVAIFKPDMVGKSIQLTLLTIPGAAAKTAS